MRGSAFVCNRVRDTGVGQRRHRCVAPSTRMSLRSDVVGGTGSVATSGAGSDDACALVRSAMLLLDDKRERREFLVASVQCDRISAAAAESLLSLVYDAPFSITIRELLRRSRHTAESVRKRHALLLERALAARGGDGAAAEAVAVERGRQRDIKRAERARAAVGDSAVAVAAVGKRRRRQLDAGRSQRVRAGLGVSVAVAAVEKHRESDRRAKQIKRSEAAGVVAAVAVECGSRDASRDVSVPLPVPVDSTRKAEIMLSAAKALRQPLDRSSLCCLSISLDL